MVYEDLDKKCVFIIIHHAIIFVPQHTPAVFICWTH